MPRGHLPVTSYLAVPVVSRTGDGHRRALPRTREARHVRRAAGAASWPASRRSSRSPSTTRACSTKEQRARAAAEAASRAKDEFLAVLSHELRTPLNAVYGWAHMLRSGELARRGRHAGARRHHAQRERAGAAHRRHAGRLPHRDRQDAARRPRRSTSEAVVEAAIDAVRPAADAKDLRLQAVLDPQALGITGDPDRLQQVVWNLLINAVKFTPAGRPRPGAPAAQRTRTSRSA